MKKLRSGYTTGACAAAAAKAATLMLITSQAQSQIEIPFPDGGRIIFPLLFCRWLDTAHTAAEAAVIKDAGDDPDVTNGAQIMAQVSFVLQKTPLTGEKIKIFAGPGVGTVTRSGLAVAVGQPAVNPVPRQMIKEAVDEVLAILPEPSRRQLNITLSIPGGEKLARKTLNHRLGIVGGLSILGTTGIVRPISADAWTATISASMKVARAAGHSNILLSTGRTSEAAVQRHLALPDVACAMMGDYLQFSLLEAEKQGFSTIHVAAMWAKILKGAMKIPQTHVRHGALEVQNAIAFLAGLKIPHQILARLEGANTAREIYERLTAHGDQETIQAVCIEARNFCQEISGLPVHIYLVTTAHSRPRISCIVNGFTPGDCPG